MPDTGAPWELPYPAIGEQADVPGDMGGLATAVAAALSGIADDLTAASVPASVLTGSAAFTAATGWSLGSGQVQKVGRLWFWGLIVNRTGAALTVSSSGDLSNVTVANLVPVVSLPMNFPAASIASGRVATGSITGAGVVSLAAVGGGGVSIATGDGISLGGIFAY